MGGTGHGTGSQEDLRGELFKRISERKTKIYYDRIGFAGKEEADD